MVVAIILAGGSGSRMGADVTKQRMPLLGHPVIWHTVRAFDACPEIDRIVVVARADEIECMKSLLAEFNKLDSVTVGGNTRAESSYLGICAAPSECDIVAIHDAARCLITPEDISRVVADAKRYGAATAVSSVTDTLKRVADDGRVLDTVDRKELVAAATPQVFGYAAIRDAFESLDTLGADITDDNMVYELAGGRVYTTYIEADNIKITRPRDILLAELILKERENV